jgi:hypothetical protein
VDGGGVSAELREIKKRGKRKHERNLNSLWREEAPCDGKDISLYIQSKWNSVIIIE